MPNRRAIGLFLIILGFLFMLLTTMVGTTLMLIIMPISAVFLVWGTLIFAKTYLD